MEKKINLKELLSKAEKPIKDAIKLHPFYQGKLEVVPKCKIKDMNDFAVWYTPGVAAPCLDIAKNPEKVYEYTNKGNFIAIVSDGTRVLGLGDIGPYAALPVMEGKAILFKYLGGVDAFPICLNTKNPEEIIKTVKYIEPTFGGINLEDIETPKCFDILDKLKKELSIPVWHDDRQGTATATLAGLINALKVVGKNKEDVRVAIIGAGAANLAIANLMIAYGFKAENMIVVDSKGIIYKDRKDLNVNDNKEKWQIAQITNKEGIKGGIAEALKGADICISLSKSGPDIIKPEWVKQMSKDSILFACANPVPEIWPWEAKEAGAKIVATGRSDFENQINNSLVFPAVFRGALDVRATTITDEMCIAAAEEIAKYAEEKGLNEEYIIPTMKDIEVFIREAVAVGMKAIEQGVAKKVMTKDELYEKVSKVIKRARKEAEVLMENGIIPTPDKD